MPKEATSGVCASHLSKLLMGLWLVLSVSVEYRDTIPEFVRDTKCSFLWGENCGGGLFGGENSPISFTGRQGFAAGRLTWKASTADVCWKVGRTAPPSFPVFESGTTEMFLSLLKKAKWVEEQDNRLESPTGMYGESSE